MKAASDTTIAEKYTFSQLSKETYLLPPDRFFPFVRFNIETSRITFCAAEGGRVTVPTRGSIETPATLIVERSAQALECRSWSVEGELPFLSIVSSGGSPFKFKLKLGTSKAAEIYTESAGECNCIQITFLKKPILTLPTVGSTIEFLKQFKNPVGFFMLGGIYKYLFYSFKDITATSSKEKP